MPCMLLCFGNTENWWGSQRSENSSLGSLRYYSILVLWTKKFRCREVQMNCTRSDKFWAEEPGLWSWSLDSVTQSSTEGQVRNMGTSKTPGRSFFKFEGILVGYWITPLCFILQVFKCVDASWRHDSSPESSGINLPFSGSLSPFSIEE